MMEARTAADDIDRVVHWELGYCAAAIDRGDLERAISELRQAEKKLKNIAHRVRRLQDQLSR
ncbi:hypothetical protein [Ciceribacter sp. RN22]|uniref:hypothetical protein n=1 Tax=Ciceribacter sp. RN22 TaxID=2954932 RepID=UPI002092E90E|nr:hypothetical protein [Ciceribacter sp. RN22]MCO6178825.1 hypothetical protein [Ciceribacter sp. RN22]